MEVMIAQEELAGIIGSNVSRLRRQKGFSQQQFAQKLGISLPHLNRIEKGKALPGAELLYALADELGVTSDNLRQAS
jgi:transcriptional regulator with XRE-family HTH domain